MRIHHSNLEQCCADWGTLLHAIGERADRYKTLVTVRFLTAEDCYEEENAILLTTPYESELLYLNKDTAEVRVNTKCAQCETEITGKWPLDPHCNECQTINRKDYEQTITDAYNQAKNGF